MKYGTFVTHKDFGNGIVVRRNMSGPIVRFANYEAEMCVPEFHLTTVADMVAEKAKIYQDFQAIALENDIITELQKGLQNE